MNTLFIGQNMIQLECVDSTNNYTIEKLRHSVIPEGTVVVADEQQHGKGQRGNTWVSQPGKNLTLSVVLYPEFIGAERLFQITKVVSLALVDCLDGLLSQRAVIKWPNDILVDGRKLAGILIENALRERKIVHTVIGVGLNVNQIDFGNVNKATSIALKMGSAYDLDKLLRSVCRHLESRYLQLKSDVSGIDSDYLERLYKMGQWAIYQVDSKKFKGRITGVTAGGLLQVESENNIVREFTFGALSFIDESPEV